MVRRGKRSKGIQEMRWMKVMRINECEMERGVEREEGNGLTVVRERGGE